MSPSRREPHASIAQAVRNLSDAVDALRFDEPVAHVYNPLVYARAAVDQYLERYLKRGVEALFLGMNPGPWGMVQTGIPFGEVELARTWLELDGVIESPRDQHPKRPIQGWACTRSEVSGRRVWGWAAERFGSPRAFFERFFVWNYCPLAFMEAGGRNRTPDKLAVDERAALYAVCDAALVEIVRAVAPERVIGIGKFAEARAKLALAELDVPIASILHPSPASPLANRGWAAQAEAQLAGLGIRIG
ncbi:MAG: single-stranded DNA-binding protein [Planctomycetota bacterium]